MDAINSNTYWNHRFSSGDWNDKGGEQQSVFFARIALESFPEWLNQLLAENSWEFIDYGCAEGSGTAYISRHFPSCSFVGVDFSESAVAAAEKLHPFCKFFLGDIEGGLKPTDVVFSSNTLEHLREPKGVLERLVLSASKYAIILCPFEDDSGVEEHFNIFQCNFFPEEIGEHHFLRYFKIIDCRDVEGTMWEGKQILLIYANDHEAKREYLRMNDVYNANISDLIESCHAYRVQLSQTEERFRNASVEYEESTRRILSERELLLARSERRTLQFQKRYREKVEEKTELMRSLHALQAYTETVTKESVALEEAYESSCAQNRNAANYMLYRIQEIRKSAPFRIAHLLVELKHMLAGTHQDRKNILHWLLRDRGAATSYNYLYEIARYAEGIYAQNQSTHLDFSKLLPKTAVANDLKLTIQMADRQAEADQVFTVLDDIISHYDAKRLVLMLPLIDWNVPLFQRPQQLAMAFAQQGLLCFYTTPNVLDNISEPLVFQPNCVLIREKDMDIVMELARVYGKHVVLDICSTDNIHFKGYLEQLGTDYSLLYEYIDEISDQITGAVPGETMERHYTFLRDERVFVVATAEKLYQEVLQHRSSAVNILYSGNGVDIAHFQVEENTEMIPEELREIATYKEPIIGYYGAIANWVDFELILYAAEQRPNYRFLLIGPHYGGHDLPILDKIKKLHNVSAPGTVPYQALPYVARYFTVATIPFVLNDITESTSPIKLFEYMAMGKPIVTTALPECLKYPEVLIGSTPDEYIECLDTAVQTALSRDASTHAEKMRRVAEKNSWKEKAGEIITMLGASRNE